MIPPSVLRARNAMVTRQAILDCARVRLREEGYDAASLREIAACAGVDAALVSRYFGSKEELLLEVLQTGGPPMELFSGPREGFGERVADLLVCAPPDDSKLDCLIIILRSLSSQAAAEAIRNSSRSNFYAPLVEWLGGPEAKIKATMIAAIMKGVTLTRFMDEGFGFSEAEMALFRDRLAETLQRVVDG
ncbi:TetR family transcriptional regulator [Phenylobacterium sp.]|jgi:AcrR family transcriptional regulator|uniref:TetR family transcriptional regulator n=1 Tax=Phenylobacterium sp. TaxID=1871053 RepID=UPI002E37CFD1|nr:TetR family transcriptional regulator [Phenylobacterium sp.]HEX2560563.1 TetR family transcriptional regulator [Phenylobacterium sp.]